MKDLFAKRLKSARLRNAMSQDQLVSAMDNLVSKNAISKYEKGDMAPSSTVLIALAKALLVKTDYFFRSASIEIEDVAFRKKRSLKAVEINAIKSLVSEHLERYLEIEELLGLKTKLINPIKKLVIKNTDDIEAAANKLLDKWNLGYNTLPNVVELLETKGIKVIEVDALEGFDGLSGWVGDQPVIVLTRGSEYIDRKRMTALHELGHILLNFDDEIDAATRERLCFRFAAAMLIPMQTFFEEFGKERKSITFNELIHIKETYGISIQGIMRRAKELNVIPEAKYREFRKKLKGNETEEGWGKYTGKEKSERFNQLVYRAVSEEIISLSKAANLTNQKLAAFRDQFDAL